MSSLRRNGHVPIRTLPKCLQMIQLLFLLLLLDLQTTKTRKPLNTPSPSQQQPSHQPPRGAKKLRPKQTVPTNSGPSTNRSGKTAKFASNVKPFDSMIHAIQPFTPSYANGTENMAAMQERGNDVYGISTSNSNGSSIATTPNIKSPESFLKFPNAYTVKKIAPNGKTGGRKSRLSSSAPSGSRCPPLPLCNWLQFEPIEMKVQQGAQSRVNMLIDHSNDQMVIKKVYTSQKDYRNELRALSCVRSPRHPYIVYPVCVDPGKSIIVLSWAGEGDLTRWNLFTDPGNPFTFRDVAVLAAQIISAVATVHRRGILHGDIKPENFVVASRERMLKLIDFGLSAKLGDYRIMTQGTPLTMAPEVAFKDFFDGDRNNTDHGGYELKFSERCRLHRGVFSAPPPRNDLRDRASVLDQNAATTESDSDSNSESNRNSNSGVDSAVSAASAVSVVSAASAVSETTDTNTQASADVQDTHIVASNAVNQPERPQYIREAMDWWSVGVTLHYMFSKYFDEVGPPSMSQSLSSQSPLVRPVLRAGYVSQRAGATRSPPNSLSNRHSDTESPISGTDQDEDFNSDVEPDDHYFPYRLIWDSRHSDILDFKFRPLPDAFTPDLLDLLDRLMTWSPEKRNFKGKELMTIVNHPFFRNNRIDWYAIDPHLYHF